MKRDARVEFSRRAARRIEEGDEAYFVIDEALVEVIQRERSQVADWLEARGFFYLADDLRRGRDEVGA